MHFSSLPCMLHALSISFALIYHPNNMWWSVQVTKLFILHSAPASHHILLGPNILLSTLFSNTFNLCSFSNVFHKKKLPLFLSNQLSCIWKQATTISNLQNVWFVVSTVRLVSKNRLYLHHEYI
jgi:hypothetical protein